VSGVLWVSAEVPDREGGGGNYRQGHLLCALAKHTDIDLLVLGDVPDEGVLASVRRLVQVDDPASGVESSRWRRRAEASVTAWLKREPLDLAEHAALRDVFAEHLRTMAPAVDAVLLHHQSLGPLLAGPRHGRSRWALSLFHAAGVRSAQAAVVNDIQLQRALLRRDGTNAARAEHDAVELADALVVVTDQDAVRLGRPTTPTSVVPNGVDLERFATTPLPSSPTVVMAGSLDYEPNIDGAAWFADEVWPSILARVPDATLFIVGRNPAPSVAALGERPGIEVHADVPDIAPWFERARVSVVPLRIGTGVRVKAMQSLAAGRPVVGTSIGMEGLDMAADEAAIVDDPAAFADAVVALLGDDELAERRRAAGRRYAETHFSWARSGELLRDALLC
jgi:glycosyltransferase involved in cell wall biosynthesis